MSRKPPSQEAVDKAYAGVVAEAERIRTEVIPYSPLDFKYRIGKTLVFAMVLHNEREKAWLLSLDGNPSEESKKWFPLSVIETKRSPVQPRFMVVTMPGWLANEKELGSQPRRPRLTPLIAWSEEDKAEWEHVVQARTERNEFVNRTKNRYRKWSGALRYGETA